LPALRLLQDLRILLVTLETGDIALVPASPGAMSCLHAPALPSDFSDHRRESGAGKGRYPQESRVGGADHRREKATAAGLSGYRIVSLVVLFWDFSTIARLNSPFLRFDLIV
jgi:hypothetical protein